ncbi:MAG: efflux RND transporter periplasmic adaptor subunit [Pontiella sp.]
MKKAIKWIIILSVIGGGSFFWLEKTKAKNEDASGPAYEVETVKLRDIRITVESTGEVQPRNRLDVKPPIAGRLEELLVDEGATVTRGQILGWISSTERATLLDAARATSKDEYAYWEELFKPSPLISPLNGTIIARNFEPGQSIVSSDSVVVIADDLIIIANLDETDIGKVKNKQVVQVSLEAYPDQEFGCIVEKIAYDAKTVSNVTMYEVDVRANRLPEFARSGMTANLEFIVEERVGVLALPASAIQQKVGSRTAGRGERPDRSAMSEDERNAFREKRMKERSGRSGESGAQASSRRADSAPIEYFVLVASEDPENPAQKIIKVGVSDGSYTEIVAGLEAGDEVLIQQMNFRSGGSSGSGLFSSTMGRGPR